MSQNYKTTGASAGGFTLIELLTVISIIALVAGLIVGLAPTATKKLKLARVEGELQNLVVAIENYKAKNGFYPPDNVISRSPWVVVDPRVNPLYYELSGTIYDPVAKGFRTLNRPDLILTTNLLGSVFHISGFYNSSDTNKNLKSFLPAFKSGQVNEVAVAGNRFEVLSVPVRGPSDLRGPSGAVNPWRYVSSSPTNNPDSFDLWAEILIGRETNVIGNWKK